jgi:hypothetical protein
MFGGEDRDGYVRIVTLCGDFPAQNIYVEFDAASPKRESGVGSDAIRLTL